MAMRSLAWILPMAFAEALAPGRAAAQPCPTPEPTMRAEERDGRRVVVIDQAFVIDARTPMPRPVALLVWAPPGGTPDAPAGMQGELAIRFEARAAEERFARQRFLQRRAAREAHPADEALAERWRRADRAWQEARPARLRSDLAAIEAFVAAHPDDPRLTPAALHLLALLRLDTAYDELDARVDETGERVLDAEPDLTAALDALRRLIAAFPDYPHRGDALALLAATSPRPDEARQASLALVCPERFDPLATPAVDPNERYEGCRAAAGDGGLFGALWTQGVGDAHFGDGQLGQAVAAYRHAAAIAGAHRPLALYKLGWSHLCQNQVARALAAFETVLALDEREPGTSLHPEALQSIALLFAEWIDPDGDDTGDFARSLRRAIDHYRDRFDEPRVRDVFNTFGDLAADARAHDAAIAAWELVIERWPRHPGRALVERKLAALRAQRAR